MAFLPACILAALLSVLLGRAMLTKTYVITDGSREFTYTAFGAGVEDVLTGAGLELTDMDTYTVEASAGTRAITICRARDITLVYHGQPQQVFSHGETAGELLRRLGITLTEEDVLTPAEDTELQSGMTVRVDNLVTRREEYTVSVPCRTVRCLSEQLPRGQEQVWMPGSDGELLRSADVTYVNGVQTRRTVLSERVLIPVSDRIVAVGTGEPEPAAPTGDAPVIGDGVITLPGGTVLTYTGTAQVRATAYTHTDEGCNKTTATGSMVHVGTVAVDPRYIPYGTRMFIVSNDGAVVYGICEAEDCGGAIKGDRVDLYYPTYEQCMAFGRRICTVYFLG